MGDWNTSNSENESFYDEYYDKPDWWFKLRYDTQYKIKSALSALKKVGFQSKGKNIFEYGFGSGELLLKFREANLLAGMEISPTAVEFVRSRTNQTLTIFNLSDIHMIYSFESYSFDLVIASHVVEHIYDTKAFIGQINYLLKKEGIVLLQIPINEKYDDPKHVHHYSIKSLSEIFEYDGYELIYSSENEYLFYLVEDIYLDPAKTQLSLSENMRRIVFNLFFSRFPFRALLYFEKIYKKNNSIKPRQAVVVLKKKLG